LITDLPAEERVVVFRILPHDLAFFKYLRPHWPLIGLTIFGSLIGVVMWGTLSGSMLPFLLRRCGFDPAAASAPFVATLVDVTGLIIYFTMAMLALRGTLLCARAVSTVAAKVQEDLHRALDTVAVGGIKYEPVPSYDFLSRRRQPRPWKAGSGCRERFARVVYRRHEDGRAAFRRC
jgi:hypothetical protein